MTELKIMPLRSIQVHRRAYYLSSVLRYRRVGKVQNVIIDVAWFGMYIVIVVLIRYAW